MIAHKKWNRTISDIEFYGDLIITTNNREGVSFWDPEWDYVGTNKILSIHNDFQLQNYPNPFNPTTTISFSLNPEIKEQAKLSIYNLKGQKIRQFSISRHQSSITWDGTDRNNKPVASGVYLYKLETKEKQLSKKMMLLK
jgi:hypothetical protein